MRISEHDVNVKCCSNSSTRACDGYCRAWSAAGAGACSLHRRGICSRGLMAAGGQRLPQPGRLPATPRPPRCGSAHRRQQSGVKIPAPHAVSSSGPCMWVSQADALFCNRSKLGSLGVLGPLAAALVLAGRRVQLQPGAGLTGKLLGPVCSLLKLVSGLHALRVYHRHGREAPRRPRGTRRRGQEALRPPRSRCSSSSSSRTCLSRWVASYNSHLVIVMQPPA